MKNYIKKQLTLIPFIKRLKEFETFYPPGHYYSPIPNKNDITKALNRKNANNGNVKGVELNPEKQLQLFKDLTIYIEDNPFRSESKGSGRFFNANGFYGFGDAYTLQSMVRHVKPDQIIEVGSGYSSLLLNLVNEKFFDNRIKLNFIEPYPERLQSLLSEKELNGKLINKPMEEVSIDLFRRLQKNDILFIDSSHVLKAGSDLHYLFFEILPVIKPGVFVHFHDIFNGFEYLPGHFEKKKGFGWNENYFLRSFLMYNNQFEVKLFLNYLDYKYGDTLKIIAPSYKPFTGAACWIKKKTNIL